MQISASELNNPAGYRLSTNLVVPRPVTWVAMQREPGIVNLALGLLAAPSVRIRTPLPADSPTILKCALRQQVPAGDNVLFICEA
jgi:flavin reductase (DIM6/NTAB) family NADH-FMN oxidoreductase RutF